MNWLLPLALIAAGLIAASAVIISTLPKAKELIDKLAPIQGGIGVFLLVVGVIKAFQVFGEMSAINSLPLLPMATIYATVVCAVLLGFLLGMPIIAKWIPGESPAEQKAMEMQKKIAAYQALIGGIGIVAAILWIYYQTKSH